MQVFSNISSYYFAGTQRVASKPAGSATRFNVFTFEGSEELKMKQLGDAQAVADSVDLGELALKDTDPGMINPTVYYFHPDHLGSSTMISDKSGYAYQFFLNLPFGANEKKSHAVFFEVCERSSMAEQRRSGSLNNPFKFNDYGEKSFGKAFDEHSARSAELDEETGLYYYGARYYDPRISLFISVDPLAEMTMTPYQYTYQNPINLIDPTGMAAEDNDGWGKRGNTWEYSYHITKDNYKDLGYSEYMDAGNIFSIINDIVDGCYNYSLNVNGNVQDSHGSSMKNKFKTGAGTTISNLDKDTSLVGFGRTAYMSGNHDPKYSPYNPDAMSVNVGSSGNWYVANYDVSLSLIFSRGNISIGGNAGGAFGINSDMPFKNFSPFNPNVSLGFHDMYGGETNVIEGLRNWSVNSTYSGGPVFLSTSTTAIPFKRNGLFSPASRGVKSTYLGAAPRSANVGVSVFGSYSGIYSFFK